MDVVIVEDEKLLAEELSEKLVYLNPDVRILQRLSSISEAVDWLRTHECDLLFLDIHLNDGLSFSIFEQIDVKCPVIFTTAYDQYAIRAFDVNSIAYLLKPIDDSELEKALEKYNSLQAHKAKDIQKVLNFIKGDTEEKENYKERLTLSLGKVQKPVRVIDIAYFMADDKHVFAITKSGKKYFSEAALYKLEEELNPKDFFRVNRRFLVNYDSVEELVVHTKGRFFIKLKPKPNEQVVVSSEKAKHFKEWLIQ